MLKSLIKPIMHFDFSQILLLLWILNDKLSVLSQNEARRRLAYIFRQISRLTSMNSITQAIKIS